MGRDLEVCIRWECECIVVCEKESGGPGLRLKNRGSGHNAGELLRYCTPGTSRHPLHQPSNIPFLKTPNITNVPHRYLILAMGPVLHRTKSQISDDDMHADKPHPKAVKSQSV